MDEHPPNFFSRNPARRAVLALVLAHIAAAAMLYYHQGLFIPRVLEIRAANGLGHGYAFGDDFYPIWLAAKSQPADLYGSSTTRAIQTGLFGRPLNAAVPTDPPVDYRTFAYPAFTVVIFSPARLVAFPGLRIFLLMLFPALTIASLWLWMRALRWQIGWLWFFTAALLTLFNYPVLEALFALQPGLIVGFFLAGSFYAVRQNKLLLAGILLALTTIKPQMTLLAIFYLLLWSVANWRERRGLSIGFAATLSALLAASLLIWPHWVASWILVILGYHKYATPPLVSELLGPSIGAVAGPVLFVVMFAAAAALAWRYRHAEYDSPQLWITLSLLLAITSVTLLPGQAVYDHIILLPGIFFLLQYRSRLWRAGRVPRFLLALGAVVFLWPWVAASALVAARPLMTPEHFYSTAIFALPIRTAGSFPFVVLALLVCAARMNFSQSPGPS